MCGGPRRTSALFATLDLLHVRQDLSLNLEQGLWPARPRAPLISTFHGAGVGDSSISMPGFLHECNGFEFKSSFLYSKCLYPLPSLQSFFPFLFPPFSSLSPFPPPLPLIRSLFFFNFRESWVFLCSPGWLETQNSPALIGIVDTHHYITLHLFLIILILPLGSDGSDEILGSFVAIIFRMIYIFI